ncbi:uncharacterized protein NECHADRAFT_79373 [Fusarium vanettenii 77-13-4]|uniref:SnoaL-like domain-containing protein n=1 Tax=Fusarium vanettenii (strain ATCC MYA-4622 / CBS 123669 / FGSC 9596 / NRRL 45880 / 77-13-4) TaxID=660122 RepID=C7YNP1_FUSV7|nr:uncharacterized protein NECHADRAFT_79373 [Fusarium vanettenii 77-13-4]EEU46609.1 hypothetical protein NECHADRAFT_79373 [Fusarium vanettenii 77-13-4]
MAKNIPERYLPQYAKEDDWDDKELQDFVTSFYRLSDNPEENQRWVDSFTDDANVQIGADKAQGSEDFRTRMWAHIQERKHTVLKVFPGKFTGSDASEPPKLSASVEKPVQPDTSWQSRGRNAGMGVGDAYCPWSNGKAPDQHAD